VVFPENQGTIMRQLDIEKDMMGIEASTNAFIQSQYVMMSIAQY
jgi:hypothetical protein